jgi:hypothetical protein
MAFMAAPASGDFIRYLKYDARSGRFFTRPEEQGGEDYEVTDMTAVMDIGNVKTGWFEFVQGGTPVVALDPSLTEAAPKPSDGAKRGFRVVLFSEKNIGGLREMSSTAGVVIGSMNELHTAWQNAPEQKAGKLPVVKCTGTTAVKSAKSTNYAPVFSIVSWVDRPAAFDGDAAPGKAAPATKTQAPPPVSDGDEPQF